MPEFFVIVFFSLLGLIVGCVTGLIPGLHVNTISLILFGSVGQIALLLRPLSLSDSLVMTTISSFIVSVAIAHTFVNIIPATFLGAPDEETALSVLPAHKLLLEGKGYEAIALSALGSFGAIMFSAALMPPFKFVVGKPLDLYSILNNNMFWILLAIVILMIATERGSGHTGIRAPLYALSVIILSGIFGIIVLDMPVDSPISLPSTVLFPALAGLFGMSTQIHSLLSEPIIREQNIEEPKIFNKKSTTLSIATGTFAGALVSVIPGITSAIGTIIAMTTRGKTDERQTIITLSAVNTACAVLVIVALFVVLKARSGVAIVISNLMHIEKWSKISPPIQLIYLLIPIVVAGSLSYPLTCLIGKKIAKHINRISYKAIIKITIVALSLLVFIFTGFIGLIVLSVATSIGLIPIFLGVRRSNCMGVLIVPLMLHFL
ncbi:MAG: tripartite tricarboxylate transporter permease [Thermoplasmata archaeon]|nr:tripartite tricarboxylate transporter permease [Thermoplasmata archaeon]